MRTTPNAWPAPEPFSGAISWHPACFVNVMPSGDPYPIVVMLTSFDVGGTERQTVELVRRLDPTRFRVHLACFHARGPLKPSVPESVTIEDFPVRGFRRPDSVRQWLRFARWCREIDARLVHTCDLYANLFGLTAAAMAGVPARIGSRREVLTGDKTRLQLTGQRVAYRRAHAVVANSGAAAAQLLREGVAASKIRLIPNGVDWLPDRPAPSHNGLRRIVMVANLRQEKGHDVLIDAAPQIFSSCPDAEICLAGNGPMADALAARARARGVGGRVQFLGHCEDVPSLLARSDIFVLPSRSEALPNALIEAMAAGLPVVASRVGGIPEIVTDGQNGVLVQPGDPAALATAVVHLIDHPGSAIALGGAARSWVRRTYSFERMVSSTERVYVEEIEAQGSRPFKASRAA
jgi:glycosyltransferase involved in cell wall biosynthesis